MASPGQPLPPIELAVHILQLTTTSKRLAGDPHLGTFKLWTHHHHYSPSITLPGGSSPAFRPISVALESANHTRRVQSTSSTSHHMPNVSEQSVKPQPRPALSHSLGRFYIVHDVDTCTSLVKDCGGMITQNLDEADFLVVDIDRISRDDPKSSLPSLRHPVTYVSTAWLHKRAHSPNSHPIHEGIVDLCNLPDPGQSVTDPPSSSSPSKPGKSSRHRRPHPSARIRQRQKAKKRLEQELQEGQEPAAGSNVTTSAIDDTHGPSNQAPEPIIGSAAGSSLSPIASRPRTPSSKPPPRAFVDCCDSSPEAVTAPDIPRLPFQPPQPAEEPPPLPSGSPPPESVLLEASPRPKKRERSAEIAHDDDSRSKAARLDQPSRAAQRLPTFGARLSAMRSWITDTAVVNYAARGLARPLEMARLLPYGKVSQPLVHPGPQSSGSSTVPEAGTSAPADHEQVPINE